MREMNQYDTSKYMRPMKQLLRDQREGKFLTRDEKQALAKEANKRRISNLRKK